MRINIKKSSMVKKLKLYNNFQPGFTNTIVMTESNAIVDLRIE